MSQITYNQASQAIREAIAGTKISLTDKEHTRINNTTTFLIRNNSGGKDWLVVRGRTDGGWPWVILTEIDMKEMNLVFLEHILIIEEAKMIAIQRRDAMRNFMLSGYTHEDSTWKADMIMEQQRESGWDSGEGKIATIYS